jgi:hypothetical protein
VDVKIEKSAPYVFVIFLEEIMERPTHGVKSNVQGELAIGYMLSNPLPKN